MADNLTNITNLTTAVTQLSSAINKVSPTWFYSAAAQSSAAIVGLIGALLITRVVGILSRKKALEQQIREYEVRIETVVEELLPREQILRDFDEEETMFSLFSFMERSNEWDYNNPPKLDELLKMIEKENLGLKRDIVKEVYPKCLEKIRDVLEREPNRRNLFFPLVGFQGQEQLALRIEEHNKEIRIVEGKQDQKKHLERLVEEKKVELISLMDTRELSKTLSVLGLFSLFGMFFPLGMLILGEELMVQFLGISYFIILSAWVGVLVYLSSNIQRIHGDDEFLSRRPSRVETLGFMEKRNLLQK